MKSAWCGKGTRPHRAALVLALVLALDAADKGTVGAVAAPLEYDLGLAHTQIGMLVAAVSLVGGAATLPAGMLVDRVKRTRLLAASILLWGLAMVASATSGSFLWLLISRLGLGMVTGVAGPSVASLIGDYVASGQRGQAYGSLLSGELVGTGVGLVGAGPVAGLLSWRWSFGLLAPPALVVGWLVWRLPEPARGRQLQQHAAQHDPTAGRAVERARIPPRPQAVLRRDPARLSIWAAIRYVLAVRTNVLLIIASSVGYFFFGGLRTFLGGLRTGALFGEPDHRQLAGAADRRRRGGRGARGRSPW
jgi:MFS family permease